MKPDLATLQAEALLAPGADKQAWKKQQRMIRNRESAALSRKRKRDRIESLEEQVNKIAETTQKKQKRKKSPRQKDVLFLSSLLLLLAQIVISRIRHCPSLSSPWWRPPPPARKEVPLPGRVVGRIWYRFADCRRFVVGKPGRTPTYLPYFPQNPISPD